ncbi:MAG: chemotaxis protein [Zetaproteobacteria bacterium]|nr:chemotaxis protein [Zetaproteobacteria bacterium]
MNSLLNKLEVGSNVFELIEFTLVRNLADGTVTEGRYGVNVAKVREVVRMPNVNPLVSLVDGVAGVFELRGIPIPAIQLTVALGDKKTPLKESQQIIVTEFSGKRAGFVVDTTKRIRRIAWEKVLPSTADKHTCISGVTLVEDNEFLFILDLERVLIEIEAKCDVSHEGSGSTLYGEDLSHVTRKEDAFGEEIKATILLADDSEIILKNAQKYLQKSGYRVIARKNGQLAKQVLERQQGGLPEGEQPVDVVVTDVEMPKLDGLSLTKWIKSQPDLAETPVILHTSLSGKANLESGKQVGANGYVVKNDITMLLSLLSELIGK